MTGSRFQRVQAVFRQVMEQDPADRQAFLDQVCGADSELRHEVASLIAAHEDESAPGLDEPALGSGFCVDTFVKSAEPPRFIDPERIGQYVIERRLGEGGMGVVYLARQEGTGQAVALKLIKSGFASKSVLARFRHEARILGRLRHAGIAQVYEAGVHTTNHSETPYIAMEYVHGPALLDYARERLLDPVQRLELFLKICSAVDHAHQKGVIHRDLKPGNILVDETGESVQPKILDFGVARMTDADIKTTTLQTEVGQLLGTIPYMSPEQTAGEPDELDTRSDVYALGVILYELLAGRLPYDFEHKMMYEAVRTIREEEPVPLASLNRSYHGDLNTILLTALEKDKSRRYQSPSELARDIRRYLDDEPISAHPPSAMYQLRKFARRNRALVAGVAAVILALSAGIVAATFYAVRESKARAEAETARHAEANQRRIATEAKDVAVAEAQRAERRFGQVHQLSRAFLFDFHDQIKDLAGSTKAREFLVTTALQYLNSLAEEPSDDPALLGDLGSAYLKVGDVQGNPFAANLGDTAGALESYRKGRQILERLAQLHPEEEQARRGLAMSHDKMGRIYTALGKLDEALLEYEAFLTVAREQFRRHPDSANAKRDLIVGHDRLGRTLASLGRFDEALERFEGGLEMVQRLAEQHPESVDWRRGLAVFRTQIGDAQAAKGNTAEALASFEACLLINRELAKSAPDNAILQRDLAVTLERLGDLHLTLEQPEAALVRFVECRKTWETLAAADPEDANAQRGMTVTCNKLGDACLDLGRHKEALEHYQAGLVIAEKLKAGNPQNVDAQRDVAYSCWRIGDAYGFMGADEARGGQERIESLRQGQEWLEKAMGYYQAMNEAGLLSEFELPLLGDLQNQIEESEMQLVELVGERS